MLVLVSPLMKRSIPLWSSVAENVPYVDEDVSGLLMTAVGIEVGYSHQHSVTKQNVVDTNSWRTQHSSRTWCKVA